MNDLHTGTISMTGRDSEKTMTNHYGWRTRIFVLSEVQTLYFRIRETTLDVSEWERVHGE